MKLVDLVGELGEVTIHGQITAFEQRDIRNEKSILIFDITDFTDSITQQLLPCSTFVPTLGSSTKTISLISCWA